MAVCVAITRSVGSVLNQRTAYLDRVVAAPETLVSALLGPRPPLHSRLGPLHENMATGYSSSTVP